MPSIYISHRKEDTPGQAAHLFKNLTDAFGPGSVCMDVARSQAGRDVRQLIDEQLADSAVVLVVIGKAWAGATDESGQRRLDSPTDLVRIETAAALSRNVPVIPVLVQGATMPNPGELPDDLADLAFRNPVTLVQSQWGSDVETLVTLLQSLLQGQLARGAGAAAGATAGATPASGAAERPRAGASPGVAARARGSRTPPLAGLPWPAWLAGTAALALIAWGLYTFMAKDEAPLEQAVAEAAKAAGLAELAIAKADAARVEAQAQIQAQVAPAPAPTPKPTPKPSAAPPKPPIAPKAETSTRPAATSPRPSEAPPPQPTLPSPTAKVLSLQKWSLNSGGCGAGPVTVMGTARFTIEKTSDAIVVTEEFRGSGGGFEVVVTGQVEFSSEQPSYEIPTTGQWSGPRVFKTAGIDRVSATDGTTPRSANVVKLQSLCG